MAKLTPRNTIVTFNLEISEEERLALIAGLRFRSVHCRNDDATSFRVETAELLQALTKETLYNG